MTGSGVVGTRDSVSRALLGADAAADTGVHVDGVANEVLAHAGGALLVHDVSHILVAEVAQGGENGVRSRLTQAAERCGLDVVAEFLHTVQVLQLTVTGDDLVQQLKQALGTDTAGGALTAGLHR